MKLFQKYMILIQESEQEWDNGLKLKKKDRGLIRNL